MNHPTTEQIREARNAANLTQSEAAAVVHRTGPNAHKRWSEWECGAVVMPAAEWELFLLKTRNVRGVA